jgi:hypothetical protein
MPTELEKAINRFARAKLQLRRSADWPQARNGQHVENQRQVFQELALEVVLQRELIRQAIDELVEAEMERIQSASQA